jgi:hypothetical protein
MMMTSADVHFGPGAAGGVQLLASSGRIVAIIVSNGTLLGLPLLVEIASVGIVPIRGERAMVARTVVTQPMRGRVGR